MAREADGHGLLPQRFTFGNTTSAWGVTVVPGMVGTLIKLISGGTLEIVNGSTPSPVGLGYPFSSGEAVAMDIAGTYFFAASGATCIVAMIRMRSAGFDDITS